MLKRKVDIVLRSQFNECVVGCVGQVWSDGLRALDAERSRVLPRRCSPADATSPRLALVVTTAPS